MKEFLLILMSYLYGSIPFALVIGKLFYNTDVRNAGSGNLGGTNAGRILGKKAGLAVIILDASKAIIVVWISGLLCQYFHLSADVKYICALACVIGHCWPIFAGFRGGKAVSTAIGYFVTIEPLWSIGALIAFLVILKISKYVSLASILTAIVILILTPFMDISLIAKIVNLCIVVILVYRHHDNIKRIKDHTESKISWM